MVYHLDLAASDEVATTLKNYCQLDADHGVEVCIVKPLAELYRFKLPGQYTTEHFRNFLVYYLENKLEPLVTVEDIHDRYEGGIEVSRGNREPECKDLD